MTLDHQQQARARAGLLAWAGFPAQRQPRPLVLLGAPVRSGGFPDGQKKLAFLHGAFAAVPGFPGPVLLVLRAEADDPRGYAGPPLLLNAAALGQTAFRTDRGPRQLPAWEIRAQDVPEPLWVLDPAVSQLAWRPPGQRQPEWNGSVATIQADDRTLTMSFTGTPRAFADYPGAEVLESGPAVVIIPTYADLGTGGYARPAYGEDRQVTVVLAEPLGHRLLLDASGSPVMVNA